MIISGRKIGELIEDSSLRRLLSMPLFEGGLAPDSRQFAFPEVKGLMPDARRSGQRDFKTGRETYLDINPKPEEGQVSISGFDLKVGRLIAWSDIVAENVTEPELLQMAHKVLEKGEEFILEPDEDGSRIYYITSFEQIKLSQDLEILVDSKSTTGRVGCMSHGVIGNTEGGELITIAQPYAFPIRVRCGKTKLSQAVIRYKNTPYMTQDEILESREVRFSGDGASLESALGPKGLLMGFDTRVAYRARKCDEPVDMDVKEEIDWKKYFELVEGNSELVCDKKTLYLLGSIGVIDLGAVCGLLSREQDVMTGTGAWGHFAGVFQPFFRGGITMEFYSHSKRKIRRGGRAGVVIFDRVDNLPESERPKDYGGSYQDQRPPRLPKMFKAD